LSDVALKHTIRINKENIQRGMTADELQDAADYLQSHYKGTPDFSVSLNYIWGKGEAYPNGYYYFSGSSYTAAAFLMDWGVPSNEHRNYLLNPDFNEIGIGIINSPQDHLMKGTGPFYTTILLGHRET